MKTKAYNRDASIIYTFEVAAIDLLAHRMVRSTLKKKIDINGAKLVRSL